MDLSALQSSLLPVFEALHRHPELGFEEHRTTALIRQTLDRFHVEQAPWPLATGAMAVIRGGRPGPVVGLRCDIDALPIQEDTPLAYASQEPGRMHACGHDFHTAVMLGAACLLQERLAELCGTVKIVFQPAEEISTGGQAVVATGLTDDAALFLAIHSYPFFPAGTLGLKPGAVMAAVDRFAIRIRGQGSHAAEPHRAVDPIVVQAAIVTAAQTLVSRTLSPFAQAVVSITHVDSGTTWNVIPDTAFLEGTVRTLNPADRVTLEQGLRRLAEETARAYGATAALDWQPGPAAVINDENLLDVARTTARRLGFAIDRQQDTMGGEDFSCYLAGRPGLFIRVGTGGGCPSHRPQFTVDPAALAPAADYFAQLAADCLTHLQEARHDA